MEKIILASASPRRQELLKLMGLEFDVIPAGIDETMDDFEPYEEQVQRLSYNKAVHVADKINNKALIIGADTIVVKDKVFGKPVDRNDAFNMLKKLQGGWHEVISGVSVVNTVTSIAETISVKTRVKMIQLTDKQIETYLDRGEYSDKAGSYGIQGFASVMIERIDGCYFNVVGLPVSKLGEILSKFGVFIL